MKLANVLLALILSLPLAVKASSIQPPKGFEGEVYKATFALYEHRGKQERFICTTEAYETIVGGYHLIGAGHCIDPKADSFSVAEDIGGPETPVTVIKHEQDKDADLAIFEMKTDKAYPVIPLGTIDGEHVGDSVINVNFAVGMAKQLSEGKISSGVIPAGDDGDTDVFLAQIFGAGGSSGSAVISANTHKIIGILIYGFNDDYEGLPVPLNIGAGVEPIDKVQDFLKRVIKPAPVISDTEFKQKFGPDHSFMLTVHGPNPTFTTGGHTFQAEIMGFELEDSLYYDVPVYIEKTITGDYRLVSTQDPNLGVSVKLIS